MRVIAAAAETLAGGSAGAGKGRPRREKTFRRQRFWQFWEQFV